MLQCKGFHYKEIKANPDTFSLKRQKASLARMIIDFKTRKSRPLKFLRNVIFVQLTRKFYDFRLYPISLGRLAG